MHYEGQSKADQSLTRRKSLEKQEENAELN